MSKYTEQQKEFDKIAAEINDMNSWNDGFGGIGDAPNRIEHRDSFPDLILTGLPAGVSNKQLLSDITIQDELARRDPKFKRKLDAQRIRDTAQAWMTATPLYVRCDENLDAILNYFRKNILKDPSLDGDEIEEAAYNAGQWTTDRLSEAFEYLKQRGKLQMPRDTYKELSEDEQIAVIAMVRRGQPGEAINAYLQLSLPNSNILHLPVEAVATEYPTLMLRCVWFIFRQLHPELSADEFKAFQRSMKHVTLPTIALLNQTLQQRNEEKLLGARGQIQSGPAPVPAPPSELQPPREMTEAEIRRLPPEELEQLITEQRQAYRRAMYAR